MMPSGKAAHVFKPYITIRIDRGAHFPVRLARRYTRRIGRDEYLRDISRKLLPFHRAEDSEPLCFPETGRPQFMPVDDPFVSFQPGTRSDLRAFQLHVFNRSSRMGFGNSARDNKNLVPKQQWGELFEKDFIWLGYA
jgi:hypothetical protein